MIVKGMARSWAGAGRKLLVMAVVTVLVTGCTWYQGLGLPQDERTEYLKDNSQFHQDENYRRFYELQKRIDELEAKLGKSAKLEDAPRTVPNFYTLNKKVEDAISYIRKKTDDSIASIDRMLAQISSPEKKQSVANNSEGSPRLEPDMSGEQSNGVYAQQGAVSGQLIRNSEGQVIKSTTTGKRYNYSVVYTYPETQPWLDMWALLNDQGVDDKWRGNNPLKSTYFIYVGAYYTPRPAERRQRNLLTITGTEPEIRIREGHQELAMK